MKKEFTTFDIARILNLNRNSLQTWLDGHFIKPSIQQASRQGTKNIFSREDLYQIQLFMDLLNAGFSREFARKIVSISFENVGPEKRYGIIMIEKPIQGKELMIGFSFDREPPKIMMGGKIRYSFVINLLDLKKDVDSLLG